jgi:hypothetical protein
MPAHVAGPLALVALAASPAVLTRVVADTRAAVEPKLQALDRSISTRLGVQPPASAPAKK